MFTKVQIKQKQILNEFKYNDTGIKQTLKKLKVNLAKY